jgi:hypothetical protein
MRTGQDAEWKAKKMGVGGGAFKIGWKVGCEKYTREKIKRVNTLLVGSS